MKDPEEAIERVLTKLRDAEAPAGMETRILGVLAARAEVPQDSWRGRAAAWRMLVKGRGFRVASGGALAGLVVMVVLLLSVRKMSSVASGVGSGTREAVPQRLPGIEQARPGLKPSLDGGLDRGLKPAATPARDGEIRVSAETADRERPGRPDAEAANAPNEPMDYSALAMSEMLAPSKPAPPLPLTKQERLLAEVVHKGDPEQVADLEPEVRAKQIEIAKAEFHEFFEPPPVKDNE